MRIKFYSTNDLSIGFNILKIKEKLDVLDIYSIETNNIDDILEFYNITLFQNNIGLEEKYSNKIKALDSIVYSYFNNMINDLSSLDTLFFDYIDDFWELFNKCKLYKKIDAKEFTKYIDKSISKILKYKEVVNEYENEILEYFEKNDDVGYLVIQDEFVENNKEKFYFPTHLNKKEVIKRYINSNNPYPGYLNMLFTISKDNALLDEEIRKEAKNKYSKIFEKIENKTKYGFNIQFVKGQKESVFINYLGTIQDVKYSLDEIVDNKDSKEYLFIYYLANVIDLIDIQGRITHLPDYYVEPIFSRDLSINLKNSYDTKEIFLLNEQFLISSLCVYDSVLKNICDLDLEKLIKWYFEDYIVKEYEINGFKFVCSESNNYIEKTRNLCAEFESIIKQFDMYCMYGYIDQQLLEYSTYSKRLGQIGSLINNKNAYIHNEKLLDYAKLIGSDQSPINVPVNKDVKHNTFFENIKELNLSIDDFDKRQKEIIGGLLKDNIVYEKDDKLYPTILCDLLNDYLHKGFLIRNYLDKFNIEDIEFSYQNGLLAKEESDYFDYCLNNTYSNGLAIRNKYMHGTNVNNAKRNMNDYYRVLLLLLYLLFKINYEFIHK